MRKTEKQMTEGIKARDMFERTMKKLFRISKSEIKEAEEKYKMTHKRKC